MRVLIVGAGLMGVSSAYYLCRCGHEVVVVDRAAAPGLETSFANGGILTPSQPEPWNAPGIASQLLRWIGREDAPFLMRLHALPTMLTWGVGFLRNSSADQWRHACLANFELARYSMLALRELRAEIPLEYAAAMRGTLRVFRDPAALAETVEIGRELGRHGLASSVVDAAGAVAREPALAPVGDLLAGGIFYPDDESGDAHRFCASLARQAQTDGVAFQFGVTARKLEFRGAKAIALHTDSGRIDADCFVVAAGSYTSLLLSRAGLRVPVRPVKGYSLTARSIAAEMLPGLPVVDEGLHVALTPLDGVLRVAGTAEIAGYDASPTESRVANLFALLEQTYPLISRALSREQVDVWAGLRPMSSDGVPLIGAIRCENLFINTGHGHLGWTMAAGSGRLLADCLSGAATGIDPQPYRPERF